MNTHSRDPSAIENGIALRGPCVMVHRAVCAEAIRVIFALRFLSRGGMDNLTQELQRCQRAASSALSEAIVTSRGSAAADTEEETDEGIASLVEKHSSSSHRRIENYKTNNLSVFDSPSAQPLDNTSSVSAIAEVDFATPAAARHCIGGASQISLLTAAHLLRCSAWTASLLTAIDETETSCHETKLLPHAKVTDNSSNASHFAGMVFLSSQAHALEILRTQEPGWCATALVRFTEWFLHGDASSSSPSSKRTGLMHALTLTMYERVNTAAISAGKLPSGAPGSHETRTSSSWYLPYADPNSNPYTRNHFSYVEKVVVPDSLSFFFPWLSSQQAIDENSSHYADNSCCCEHRWFLGDLPRWCVQVAVDRQASSWYRHRVLRGAVARWRARRGLRVMAYLTRAAGQRQECADTGAAANAIECANGNHVLTVDEGILTHKAETLHKTASRAERHAEECQTEQVSRKLLPTVAVEEGGEDDKFSTPSQVLQQPDAKSAVQSAEVLQVQSGSSSFVTQNDQIRSQPSKTNAVNEVPLLDRALQGTSRIEQHATSGENNVEASKASHNEDAERNSTCETQPPLATIVTTPPRSPSGTHSRTGKNSFATYRGAANCSERKEQHAALTVVPEKDSKVQEEQRVIQFQEHRNLAQMRGAFLYWRNRRLYESMAARYVRRNHQARTTQHCWHLWVHRSAVASQRRKEGRDDALGEMVTEQKAVRYFCRLLQGWRRAALARRFFVHTVGNRVFLSWRCKARLMQWQKTTRQPYVRALGIKRAVWQRWCERHLDVTAEQFRVRHLLTRTLGVMQTRCHERTVFKTAVKTHCKAVMEQVWRMWTQRLTRTSQLCTTADIVRYDERLKARVWRLWRVRLRERERNRGHEVVVKSFRAQHALQKCFGSWVSCFRLAWRARVYAERHQRSSLLQPAFEKWRVRTEVRSVVRHGQEDLAWKVGEQLQCRKVWRVWRRRAVAHAAAQKAARAEKNEEDADRVARLSRLARTFYHWRMRGFVLRRYQVDRRRCLPELTLQKRPLEIEEKTGTLRHRVKDSSSVKSKSRSSSTAQASADQPEIGGSPYTTTLPLPPASSQPSRNSSARVSPRAARRRAKEAVPKTLQKPPERSMLRRHNTASALRGERNDDGLHNNTTALTREAMTEKEDARTVVELVHPQAVPLATFVCGKSRAEGLVVSVRQSAMPPWRRTLALERQLFAVQRHTSLAAFGVCFPTTSTERQELAPRSTEAASQTAPAFVEDTTVVPGKDQMHFRFNGIRARSGMQPPTHSMAKQSRFCASPRTLSPPSHFGHENSSNDSNTTSDADRQLPIRSRTATPLFSRKNIPGSSSKATLRTSQFASDLVESPPQHLPQQLHSMRKGDAYPEDNFTISYTPRQSSHHLLSQMELLLQRVRGIEAGYRSLPTSRPGAV